MAFLDFFGRLRTSRLVEACEPAGEGRSERMVQAQVISDSHRRTLLNIDASASMDIADWDPTRLDAAIDRALEYIDASSATNPANEVAVISYDDFARLVCPFGPCSRRSEITPLIESIESGGGTDIAAALELSANLISSIRKGRFEFLVHLLTDGGHNGPGDPVGAADALKNLGAVIDVVGIGGDPSAVNEALLRQIASDHPGGGKRYRFIGDPQRLSEHYQRLAGRLTL